MQSIYTVFSAIPYLAGTFIRAVIDETSFPPRVGRIGE